MVIKAITVLERLNRHFVDMKSCKNSCLRSLRRQFKVMINFPFKQFLRIKRYLPENVDDDENDVSDVKRSSMREENL